MNTPWLSQKMRQSFWLWVKVVNPCLILGYNLPDKIAGIFFIVRQEIPRNIELIPFLIIGQHLRHKSCRNFNIPKMYVRIDCTALKLMPTSLAMFAGLTLTWPGCARAWHFRQWWYLWGGQTFRHYQLSRSPPL